MKQILIVEDCLKENKIILNFLLKKNCYVKIINKEDSIKTKHDKSTLICSKEFQESIGGKSELLKISRNIGSTNIIVLNKCEKTYSLFNELGGAYLVISYSELDKVITEIIFQVIETEKYSFSDPKTNSLINMAKKVAETDVTVFIHGPTGTGKEVISNYIHKNSSRADNPFVAINCAAIPENMLEAILFGHEKGAFTGASNANKGIFRAADKGTLLLDEISEMPLSLQAKLLRVLQERKVTPVGGQRDIDVDVRVLATSNRDMAYEVNQSRFREDLYYRLNVFPLQTQNLSSRKDDILPIAIKILDKHNQEGKSSPYLTNEARELLLSHNWPGNVRELENTLQRALVLSNENIIDEKSIMIDKSLSKINENSSVDSFADQLAFAKVT